jgi:hypothetical protein
MMSRFNFPEGCFGALNPSIQKAALGSCPLLLPWSNLPPCQKTQPPSPPGAVFFILQALSGLPIKRIGNPTACAQSLHAFGASQACALRSTWGTWVVALCQLPEMSIFGQ